MNDLGLLDFSHYNAMQDNARKTEALSETLKNQRDSTWLTVSDLTWFNIFELV